MNDAMEVEHLLRGWKPSLLEKLWPLVPDPVKDPDTFLEHLLKYSQAAEVSQHRDWAEEIERNISKPLY